MRCGACGAGGAIASACSTKLEKTSTRFSFTCSRLTCSLACTLMIHVRTSSASSLSRCFPIPWVLCEILSVHSHYSLRSYIIPRDYGYVAQIPPSTWSHFSPMDDRPSNCAMHCNFLLPDLVTNPPPPSKCPHLHLPHVGALREVDIFPNIHALVFPSAHHRVRDGDGEAAVSVQTGGVP